MFKFGPCCKAIYYFIPSLLKKIYELQANGKLREIKKNEKEKKLYINTNI